MCQWDAEPGLQCLVQRAPAGFAGPGDVTIAGCSRRWEMEDLESLFVASICLATDTEGRQLIISGQHRIRRTRPSVLPLTFISSVLGALMARMGQPRFGEVE